MGKARTTITIDKETHRKLKEIALRLNRSIVSTVKYIVDRFHEELFRESEHG